MDNGDINLKETGSYEDGLWQSSISVNARTNEFHTENDSTYTVITIPKQEANEKAEADYAFFFKVQDKHNVSIKLSEGLTFVFSGKLLTHRQSCNKESSIENELFINFASYGTQRLFTHIKNTFMRQKLNK